ncbi:alpha amylase C-terminal domain-containing protein, partial [Clostridium neonatale]
YKYNVKEDTYIYIAINMHWEMHKFSLPIIPANKKWYKFCDTSCKYGEDIYEENKYILIENQNEIYVNPRSIIILTGKSKQ